MVRHAHFRRRYLSQQEAEDPSGQDFSGREQQEESLIIMDQQEMAAFFALLDDDLIQHFLCMDSCYMVTDKYLLAITFIYFKRAHFTANEHTRMNFFIALYLANMMEEEETGNRFEIFPWALGGNWRRQFPSFIKKKDQLWARMEYRTAVSRHCCEEVMAIVPSHSLWNRERPEHHSGAQRHYSGEGFQWPRGPSSVPVACTLCSMTVRTQEPRASDHSGSPESSAQDSEAEQDGPLIRIKEERRGSKRTWDGQLKDHSRCPDPQEGPSHSDPVARPQDLGSPSVGVLKVRKVTEATGLPIGSAPHVGALVPSCIIL
ncbi:speedy protein A-like [Brienomyrus brachyistius]|uniref:speedy protein A-like n=1 Tax=Brienomyrus brachyistius TaxID=42636 RepID=UPI0020B1C599|nr:speedy protein A-like [Brienomyrus brachyistius]XP_048850175.1 speedy protein A-like [Brienomyrus brachyistius]XP_048850176.1 speedy protein A-like [Brienomyrus brachyistius]XP_048850177.1 speedy protein A-like [Brienomyrus brachyistius]XP_048850178.1 speedy protein A-like [Brienomyrus brachyistius]